MIAYLSTFRITFLVVPFFGMGRFDLKSSCLNATLQPSTFRTYREQSGMIAFSNERGLNERVETILTPTRAIYRVIGFFYNLLKIKDQESMNPVWLPQS